MTTYDPKYKHKPSEKHTLEEVLKSLQDMIRNDLPDNDQAVAPAKKSRSETVSSAEQLHREHATPVREDFAPLTPNTGPVNLDAVLRSLNDLISNELNVGGKPAPEKATTPSLPEQSATDLNVSEKFVPLDVELSFEDSAEPIVGKEHAPMDETAPPVEQRLTGENVPDEFVPLDEELSIEEPLELEIAPNPPTEDALPELPGEISPELLNETNVEKPPPPPKPKLEGGENMATGPQQEFLLQESPPREIGYEPLAQDSTQEPESEPTPETVDRTSAITGEPASQDIQNTHDEALPTIEVEETFDESAYFAVEEQLEENQPTEIQEIQEIVDSALDAPVEPESPPESPVSSEEQKSDQNLASTPESEAAPETELQESPPTTGVTLDIEDEPTAEVPNLSSADFDTIDLEPLKNEQAPSATTTEAPAPAGEQPPATVEMPTAPEAPHEAVTVSKEPAPTGVDVESKPEMEPEKPPDSQAADSGSRKSRKTKPGSKHKPTEPSSSPSIDDIPVLKDVVAPPAGSTLVSEPASPLSEARLPAPDRARNIVVRAVAKLNVEMRKSGGTGIDTKTILRLQKFIQQELERDGEK